MSLVNEALRKARHEQAVQEARSQGLPDPLPLSYNPYRPKSRTSPLVATLAVALLVLAAAGAIAFFAARTTPTSTTAAAPSPAPTAVATAPSPASPRPEAQAPPAASTAASVPPGEEPSGRRVSGARAPQPPPATANRAPSAPAEEAARPAKPPVAPATPTATAPAAAIRDGAVFHRKMPLPDGTTLELGGIAFSDVAPFAYLNGRLVGVGEGVAGWRIVAIERTHVQLSDGTSTVRLELK